MLPVSHISKAVADAALAATGTAPAPRHATTPFSGLLRSMVEQAGSLESKAKDTVSGLLSGQGVEVHDAMIATQKADIAFELALQVRNKAVGAYQQMMQMQF